MQRTFFQFAAVSFLSVFVLMLTACRAPAGVGEFARSTDALAASIRATGSHAAAEIANHTRAWPPDQREQAIQLSDQLRVRWTKRDALADAIDDYAHELNAIVASGEGGEQSVQAFVQAVGRLSASVDLALPPAAIGSRTVKIGAAAYGALVRDLAAADLEDAMQQATPTVNALVACMDADLAAIQESLQALRDDAAATIDEQPVNGMLPREERGVLRILIARQHELRARSGLFGPESSSASNRADALSELESVERSITLSMTRLKPVDDRITQAETHLAAAIDYVARIREALAAWEEAHAQVLNSARRRTPVNLDDLTRMANKLASRPG